MFGGRGDIIKRCLKVFLVLAALLPVLRLSVRADVINESRDGLVGAGVYLGGFILIIVLVIAVVGGANFLIRFLNKKGKRGK